MLVFYRHWTGGIAWRYDSSQKYGVASELRNYPKKFCQFVWLNSLSSFCISFNILHNKIETLKLSRDGIINSIEINMNYWIELWIINMNYMNKNQCVCNIWTMNSKINYLQNKIKIARNQTKNWSIQGWWGINLNKYFN